jgi:hypothetical protein
MMSLISNMKRKLRGWIAGYNDSEGMPMERRQSEDRKVNRRYRRAAERIWENSSLRDELNDDQAQRLLDWGSGYLKKVVNETAELADNDAENILEALTERVTGLMRQVNRLTRAMTSGDEQEVSEHLKALREKLDGLLETTADSSTNVEQLMALPEQDRDHIFETLMTWLDGEEE